ncbi:12372_t:CDS:10 [Cetraspora pellucida]|uniref:12372_t:CDS:1 n=1 Tax=Cetraspora pellucida TaxID=1433469 RepID=A0A9N8ZP71_9GLOM|nr:12372_t:CDS:10 [Cetraspora pellucida]
MFKVDGTEYAFSTWFAEIESKKYEARMTEEQAQEILNAIDNGEFLIKVKFIRNDSVYGDESQTKITFKIIDKYEPICESKKTDRKFIKGGPNFILIKKTKPGFWIKIDKKFLVKEVSKQSEPDVNRLMPIKDGKYKEIEMVVHNGQAFPRNQHFLRDRIVEYYKGDTWEAINNTLQESLKVVDLAEQYPISEKINDDIKQACVEHGHGGHWNASNYHINNIICINMKECYPASMQGQGECALWFNRFGHPTYHLVQVAVNGKLLQDDITGFAQINSFKEGCIKNKGWALIVLLQYLLETDKGELDFLIKDCTDAGTFAERERYLLEFILTYFEGHQPQYTHLQASILAYAHINLLKMLRKFDSNEVIRIATNSIYVQKETLYKIKNIPAFFNQVEIKEFLKTKRLLVKYECKRHTPFVCRFCFGKWFYKLDSCQKQLNQQEEQEVQEIQLDINMIIFTYTNALAKDFQEKHNVKAQTWHSFFRWNEVEEWTSECMEEKKFPQVICYDNDAQPPLFFGKMPHNWLKEHVDYYEEVLTNYYAKYSKLREFKKAMPRNRYKQNCLVQIPGPSEKKKLVKNNIVYLFLNTLLAKFLKDILADKKVINWELGYAMTIHTSQGMTFKSPQHVWIIDENLAWNNLIYLAVGHVKYLNQLIQVEAPSLPSKIDKEKSRKFDLTVDYILTLKCIQENKCALCLIEIKFKWDQPGDILQ